MSSPERRRPPVVTSRDVWIVLANTLAMVGGLAILWQVRSVVGWVLVALLISLAVQPAVAWLTRRGLRHGLAVLLVFVLLGGVFGTMIATVVPMVVEQGQQLAERAPEFLDRFQQTRPVRWADRHLNLIDRLEEAFREGLAELAAPALAIAGRVLYALVGTVSVFALTVFMLLFGDEIYGGSLAWVAPERRQHWDDLFQKMRKVVGGYVLGTFLVALTSGVVMGVTTVILGVPYFLPLGLIMVVLSLIPFVGSAIGAVLVVGVTLGSVGLRAGIIAAVVYLVYQQIENEFLQPMVQKRTIRMNPLLITVVILAGTMLAGILGTLLALPIAGAIQVLLRDALARRQAKWEKAAEVEDVDSGTQGQD